MSFADFTDPVPEMPPNLPPGQPHGRPANGARYIRNRRLFGGVPLEVPNDGSGLFPRDEELEQAEIRSRVKVRLFDLGVINDQDAYAKVLQGVADGENRINHSEHHYDPADKCMRVYMEWSELYAVAPTPDSMGDLT